MYRACCDSLLRLPLYEDKHRHTDVHTPPLSPVLMSVTPLTRPPPPLTSRSVTPLTPLPQWALLTPSLTIVTVCYPPRALQPRAHVWAHLPAWIYPGNTLPPVFSYKLRYIVGFWLVEMAISTNQKPTIYRHLYENTAPAPLFVLLLGQRRRRWANIKTTLAERLVFAQCCNMTCRSFVFIYLFHLPVSMLVNSVIVMAWSKHDIETWPQLMAHCHHSATTVSMKSLNEAWGERDCPDFILKNKLRTTCEISRMNPQNLVPYHEYVVLELCHFSIDEFYSKYATSWCGQWGIHATRGLKG